jgi:hypothetical protein
MGIAPNPSQQLQDLRSLNRSQPLIRQHLVKLWLNATKQSAIIEPLPRERVERNPANDRGLLLTIPVQTLRSARLRSPQTPSVIRDRSALTRLIGKPDDLYFCPKHWAVYPRTARVGSIFKTV